MYRSYCSNSWTCKKLYICQRHHFFCSTNIVHVQSPLTWKAGYVLHQTVKVFYYFVCSSHISVALQISSAFWKETFFLYSVKKTHWAVREELGSHCVVHFSAFPIGDHQWYKAERAIHVYIPHWNGWWNISAT